MARKPPVRIVAHKRKVIRRAGIILAVGLGHPWVTGTVSRPLAFGRTITAAAPIAATVSRTLAFGRAITAAGAAIPGRANHALVVRRKPPIKRHGTIIVQGISVPPQAISGTLARVLAFGRTISVTAIDSTLPGTGAIRVARPPKPKRQKRPVLVRVPQITPVVGSSATVNRVLAFGRSITVTPQIGITLSRRLAFGRTITTGARVDATLARVLAFGRSISATSGVTGPPIGTPTSAIPTDNGLRSVLLADAGSRSAVPTDNGRRSVFVMNTT